MYASAGCQETKPIKAKCRLSGMPVHIMGQPCHMDAICEIAKKHNLKVIEDAAQAHLSEYKGKKLRTIGDLGCFRFQSSKTIACGEGGCIIGNDEELMDKCYTVHNHGTSRRGRTEVAGPKYHMSEFASGEAALYLDGVSTGLVTSGQPSEFAEWQYPMIIGARQNRATVEWFYVGAIDDYRVYNYPLDGYEVAELYTSLAGGEICVEYPIGDFNQDCQVDLIDLATLAEQWLKCNWVPPTACN